MHGVYNNIAVGETVAVALFEGFSLAIFSFSLHLSLSLSFLLSLVILVQNPFYELFVNLITGIYSMVGID